MVEALLLAGIDSDGFQENVQRLREAGSLNPMQAFFAHWSLTLSYLCLEFVVLNSLLSLSPNDKDNVSSLFIRILH